MTYKIYCDMDGVLTNFRKGFKEVTGRDVENTPKFWTHLIGNEGFWAHMEWMPDGRMMWNFIKKRNPTILSSPTQDPSCIEGKNEWINNYLSRDVHRIFSTKKYKYAQPNAILIDDMEKNIEPWVSAGGIGILHTSSVETIKKLKKILL